MDKTLADLVAEVPSRATVFDRLALDYCCHGQRSLAHACRQAGIDAREVVDALESVSEASSATETISTDPVALAEEILATHHDYLRRELPALVALAEKVETAHGDRHPELPMVTALVATLRADLEPHLDKEEQILFPAIRRLAAGEVAFPFGSIRNPISVMGREHDRAGGLLTRLRQVTAGYTVPADGCASYQALYWRLQRLETDTHLHIHKENNFLFPMVEALEGR